MLVYNAQPTYELLANSHTRTSHLLKGDSGEILHRNSPCLTYPGIVVDWTE